jgi:hypothetical protein
MSGSESQQPNGDRHLTDNSNLATNCLPRGPRPRQILLPFNKPFSVEVPVHSASIEHLRTYHR